MSGYEIWVGNEVVVSGADEPERETDVEERIPDPDDAEALALDYWKRARTTMTGLLEAPAA